MRTACPQAPTVAPFLPRGSPGGGGGGASGGADGVPSYSPPRIADVPDASRDRLLLLDGHSLAYRAFFALPVENFSTATGQATNAVYGFTSMLINVLRD